MSASVVPSIKDMAAGLVVAAASTSTGQSTFAAIEHGGETFLNHNKNLAPLMTGAEAALGIAANMAGVGALWNVLQALLPFIGQTTPHPINTPVAAPPPATAA